MVDDDAYLLGLVRYIHLNPLRAGLVRSVAALARYPWSGHATLMGHMERPFQDVDEILGRFGRRVVNARRHLTEFMLDRKAAGNEERLFKGGGLIRSAGGLEQLQKTPKDERQLYDERILGDGQFVRAMLEKAGDTKQAIGLSESKNEAQFIALRERVCRRLRADPKSLRAGGRTKQVVRARVVVAYIARRYLKFAGIDLARHLGVSPSAISRCLAKGEQEVRNQGWGVEELSEQAN